MVIDIANMTLNIGGNVDSTFELKNIIPIVISLIALATSIIQWFSNKQVSLKSEFIKNEKQVLLNFREKYIKAQLAFFWYRDYILTPMKFVHKVQEPLTVSLQEFQINYNLINELNDIYNMNQHIFAKHHLEKYCSAISVFLGVFQGFNYSDFNTYKIEKEGYNEYRIDMFDPIVKKFTKDFSRIYGNEEIDTFDNNKDYYLFEKFRDTFFEDMFELEFILDNITLYSSNKNAKKKFRDTFFEDMFELEFILDNITLYSSNKNAKKKFREKRFYPKYKKFAIEKERNFSETIINDRQN